MTRRPQLERRAKWLDRLAEALERLGASEWTHALWAALYDLLRAEGMGGHDASRVALRGARLALLLLDGVEQRAAARALGRSERTGKLDASRLRRVVEGGVLDNPRVGQVAGLRRRPEDRVAAPPSGLRRRAG